MNEQKITRLLRPENYVQLLVSIYEKPTLRYAPSGIAIATLTGTKSMGKNKITGEWYPSLWTKWTAFGDLAESISQLKKGQKVVLRGDMKPEEWIDKISGEKRKAISFVLCEYELHASVNNE